MNTTILFYISKQNIRQLKVSAKKLNPAEIFSCQNFSDFFSWLCFLVSRGFIFPDGRFWLFLLVSCYSERAKMFVLCKYLIDQYYTQRVIISSPDTDVAVISCYHYFTTFQTSLNELWFKTGTGNKRRYLSIHETATSLGPCICRILPALHNITRCDSVSSFLAIEKTKCQRVESKC